MRPLALAALAFVLAAALLLPHARAQDPLTEGWPRWPRLVTSTPPEAWGQGGAGGVAAWQATARLSAVEDATLADADVARRVVERATGPAVGASDDGPAFARTLLRFEGEGGAVLVAAVPALPADGPFARALAAGQQVQVRLARRQGFGGAARGLTVRGADGRLLLLFDDGAYGAAFEGPGERDDITLERPEAPGADAWVKVPVTFHRGADQARVEEGAPAALGRSGLAVLLVVSRQWTGPAVMDADTSPCAWVVYRVRS
jgi:hypothetical protein